MGRLTTAFAYGSGLALLEGEQFPGISIGTSIDRIIEYQTHCTAR